DGGGQINQLLLVEDLPRELVDIVRDVVDADERNGFRPRERGALPFRVKRRLRHRLTAYRRCSVSPSERATFVCMSAQYAQPLMSDARSLTSSRRIGSSPLW